MELDTKKNDSRFIESPVRPYVIGKDLEAAYEQMAQDKAREAEALDWAEATVGDVADETRLRFDMQAIEQAIKVQIDLT